VPLKALVVGRGPTVSECDRLEDYAEIGELVGDLRVGCPVEILKWGMGNEISSVWSETGVPGPVRPNGNLMVLS
jgi:hypothetical protein